MELVSGKPYADKLQGPGYSLFGQPSRERPENWAKPLDFPPPSRPWAIAVGGVSVFLVSCGYALFKRWSEGRVGKGWSSQGSARYDWSRAVDPAPKPPEPPPQPSQSTEKRKPEQLLIPSDPDFSTIILEDLVHALFIDMHMSAGQASVGGSLYFSESVQRAQSHRLGETVDAVIVGSLQLCPSTSPIQGKCVVEASIEAVITGQRDGTEVARWLVERWTLSRQLHVRSGKPRRLFLDKGGVRVLACPECGAPLEKDLTRKCRHCGDLVPGAHSWMVERTRIVRMAYRPPVLTTTVEEVGTDLPTIVDAECGARLSAWTRRDPTFQTALLATVRRTFDEMQVAWSEQKWERARPYLTRRLHEALDYWMVAYSRQALRNITAKTKITKTEIVRIEEDSWFESATVRVFAEGLDYTIGASDGIVKAGSNKVKRSYSEYWTFIRSASPDEETPSSREPRPCPECGAALDPASAMSLQCGKCGAIVEFGSFDWVLARIEQDEAYLG
ncbi:MAG: TIM44-like domain-containing protein [Polyangiaceae bacterium]